MKIARKPSFVFVLAFLATCTIIKSVNSTSPKVIDCLKNIILQPHDQNDVLPQLGTLEAESAQALVSNYVSFDSITRKRIDDCKLNLSKAKARCETVNGAGNCVQGDSVCMVKNCPDGLMRRGDNKCVISCPEGYNDQGYYCEKPKSYTLRNFDNEATCKSETGGDCRIWHVRYWVGMCKKNYRVLGSTVCMGECPYGTEDQGEFCVKKAAGDAGKVFYYELADDN